MKGIILSDMHSDGVYFNREEELNVLLLVGDESLCHYRGLRSVMSYEEQKDEVEFHQGHS
jgi:hypothetical protein